MSHDHREAIAEILAEHGVGQVVSLGHGGWDVRDVPPDVIDALLGSDALAQIRAEARAEALREAADQAIRDAAHCPEGCGTQSCRRTNIVTAAWLRARAEGSA